MPKRSLVIAIFHASLKVFKRSSGHSAVAAAAYRSGTSLRCDVTGTVHDYRKRAGVVAVEVLKPSKSPAWASDPERLFNAAEASDRRVNSRLARELEISLPAELDADQHRALARDISQMLVDSYGVAVMMAIHAPDARGNQRNHHAHLLFTTRALGAQGFTAKVRQLDDQKTGPLEVDAIRRRVATITNEHLRCAGQSERVDHRRLSAQLRDAERRGDMAAAALLSREPTKHEGKTATAMRRRGERSERAGINARVKVTNRQTLTAFIAKARAQGRVMEPPDRSGREQAQGDRRREAARSSTAGQRSRRVPSGSRVLRQKLNASAGRGTRAEGVDANLLNTQAAHASETRRTERDVAQRYLDMLQSIIDEHGQRVADAVAYARLRKWPTIDARVLAEHRLRDPRCGILLAQGLDADAQRRRAQTLGPRRRERYGTAMVATTRERRAVEQAEDSQPPAWKKRTRREWAEQRRRQRANLEHAERRERRAQILITPEAMARYDHKSQCARDALDQIEGTRRQRYPVPGDKMRSQATMRSDQSKARPVVTRRPEPANARPNVDTIPPHDRATPGAKPAPPRRPQPGR